MDTRKTAPLAVCLCLAALAAASAQEAPLAQGLSIQARLGQTASGGLSMGVGIASPLILGCAAARLEAEAAWFKGLSGGLEAWMPYALVKAGLAGYSGEPGRGFRLYGAGGVEFALLTEAFTGASWQFGGWGLMGFEFFATQSLAYFLELGTSGSSAVADLMPSKPAFLNGFEIGCGLRYFF